jgi:hypothetical protein
VFSSCNRVSPHRKSVGVRPQSQSTGERFEGGGGSRKLSRVSNLSVVDSDSDHSSDVSLGQPPEQGLRVDSGLLTQTLNHASVSVVQRARRESIVDPE